MQNRYLNMEKNDNLNLKKRTVTINEILDSDKRERRVRDLKSIEVFYKENIEPYIFKRNNIGLTFLIIKNDNLIQNNIKINILLEYLNEIGFKSYVNKADDNSSICVDWKNINTSILNGADIALKDKLDKEHALCNIPAAKKIEEYIYREILPFIREDAANDKNVFDIKLPKELQPMPCQKILFEIFKKNGVQFSVVPKNPSIVTLVWKEGISLSCEDDIFTLDRHHKYMIEASMEIGDIDYKIEEIPPYWEANMRLRKRKSYEYTKQEIISCCSKINEFYFDNLDIDKLSDISKLPNQKVKSFKEKNKENSDDDNSYYSGICLNGEVVGFILSVCITLVIFAAFIFAIKL